MWTYRGVPGFGLPDVKREGHKIGPSTYLDFTGDWPPKSMYSEKEYQQLVKEGWEFVED